MFGFKWTSLQAVFLLAWLAENYTFGSLVIRIIFGVLLCCAIVFAILTYDHDYWRWRGIPSPPAMPLVGHIQSVVTFKEQGGMCYKRIYDEYPDVRFLGTHQFFTRTLVIRDPDLIRRICVNDFQHFMDRGFFFNKEVDPLAGSVLYLRGNEWRKLRSKISPIFSPNKLKNMLPLIENTANEFVIRVRRLVTAKNKPKNKEINNVNGKVDINCNNIEVTNVNIFKDIKNIKVVNQKEMSLHLNKDITANGKENKVNPSESMKYGQENKKSTINNSRIAKEDINDTEDSVEVNSEKLVGGYTADAIVPCAFGLKSNVMDNEEDPFAVALHAFYEMTLYNIFEKTMQQFWPGFAMFFRMRIIPKLTHDFFTNIVTSVLRAREKGEQEKRGDFIDMMMALRNDDKNNNKTDPDVEITDMVISANAFIIFLGGFETTSSTLAFLFLELADNPEVQEKMREEILTVLDKYHGEMSFEVLQELNYMEMVIQETLRLYPPFPTIQRLCTKDYHIPGTEKVVERGSMVLFPTLGLHRDEKYFNNANAFIPERWSEAPPPAGVYMPFGDGPRYCIGKRFALIQMKCCLARVLQHIRISPALPLDARLRRRAEPFPPDPRSPLTLHPLDSRVRLTSL